VTSIPVDSGRRSNFEDFYRRRAGDALRYATAIVGQEEAEDACQEAWLRIWRAWEQADPVRLDAWAFRVVRNACLDRHRARRPAYSLDGMDVRASGSIEDIVLPRVEADAALMLVRHLSLPLREALWLREVSGLSYAEIAAVQEVPVGTVMSRLHAARRKLAKMLDGGQP
jgi:RNA polymerase sigma-70 factor, ECF subfamily